MTRAVHTLLVLLGAATLGCAGESAGEGTVELGTGEWEFVPLADEDTVPLVFGVQGGYHVWTSFRTEGLDPDGVMLEIETQPGDGSKPPELSRVPVDMQPNGELVGWPAILSEPSCSLGQMLRIRVTLTDAHGVRAIDERYVRPTAGTGTPPPPPCE